MKDRVYLASQAKRSDEPPTLQAVYSSGVRLVDHDVAAVSGNQLVRDLDDIAERCEVAVHAIQALQSHKDRRAARSDRRTRVEDP